VSSVAVGRVPSIPAPFDAARVAQLREAFDRDGFVHIPGVSDRRRYLLQLAYGMRWVSQRFYPFVNYRRVPL